jgi:hypothetical protein
MSAGCHHAAMDAPDPQPDPRKVRAGLAVVVVVVVVSVVLLLVVDDPLGKAVMVAVALTGVVRAFLLTRSLRKERPGG